ncbi:hypothetical protein [Castellaniella denitrificans]|uniref:Uncharacterized protein n=1 Tax=Castellaniella denitrificans TaxID=56119 RepID=A0ABT4M8F5_9BURK|nr:hypothetical protein [Castellaniella denitrificans]MCZ4330750.1 hypothetical protein [Castellaniella denitrificans]
MSNILPSLPTYGSAFTSNADRRFDIRTCDIPGIAQPVSIRADSFLVLLDLDEATALGTRLIAAADHYRKAARAAETVAEGA